jgi:erythronate-4-phosphate dehydrogenase
MKIIADASIAIDERLFPPPFQLLKVPQDSIGHQLHDAEILLCRSTLKVDRDLLTNSNIKIVASATSGIDHIDQECLNKRSITLLDAKGANATAVADYITALIASLNMPIKTIGIVGVGFVGTAVKHRLETLNYQCLVCDPPRAKRESFKSEELETLAGCDLISLHTPLTFSGEYPSFNLIDDTFLSKMKTGSVLVNAARGGVVDEIAMLKHAHRIHYCADVFCNEPTINLELVKKCTIATPHIAGHSIEAKQRAIKILSKKIHQHYHLPIPTYDKTQNLEKNLLHSDWQQNVLNLYNPRLESEQLKSASSAKHAKELFLTLRKKHTTRHEFHHLFQLHEMS